jgi:hypothetical protein
VLEAGGTTKDYFNTVTLLLVALFNLIDQLIKGQDIFGRSYMTMPFLVIAFLIVNYRTSKATKTLMFLLLGIGYQITTPDPTCLGASIFFVIAFMQYGKMKHGLFVLLISLITVVIKTTVTNGTPSDLIITILGLVFLYGNVYLIIQEYKSKIGDLQRQLKEKHKTKPVIRNLDLIKISEEDKAVLKMYLNGYDYAKISKFLDIDIKKESIRKKITRIRDTTTCENDMQFAIWLYDIV